jgi:hypothetical protein
VVSLPGIFHHVQDEQNQLLESKNLGSIMALGYDVGQMDWAGLFQVWGSIAKLGQHFAGIFRSVELLRELVDNDVGLFAFQSVTELWCECK